MNPIKIITDTIQPLTVKPDSIYYELFETSVGNLLVAVTEVGPCLVTFADTNESAQAILSRLFPGIHCERTSNALIQAVKTRLLGGGLLDATPLTFHLKGTDFQLRVWQELLQVPWGQTTTYGELAKRIGQPTASRAVGNAVGDNPIFCLIPCHRVVRANGEVGNYRWGTPLKQLLLDAES
jgi:AraC family transcriptional regulator of adaptative response/methylated-DNA-[protein]-cysteine methyltransferase